MNWNAITAIVTLVAILVALHTASLPLKLDAQRRLRTGRSLAMLLVQRLLRYEVHSRAALLLIDKNPPSVERYNQAVLMALWVELEGFSEIKNHLDLYDDALASLMAACISDCESTQALLAPQGVVHSLEEINASRVGALAALISGQCTSIARTRVALSLFLFGGPPESTEQAASIHAQAHDPDLELELRREIINGMAASVDNASVAN